MYGQNKRKEEKNYGHKKAEETRRIPKRKEVTDAEREKDVNDERNIARIMQVFPRTLPDALNIVMKEYQIKTEDLAGDSDLNEKTIDRIRTKNTYKPKLQTMIQLCIGLRVPTVICLALIEVSGYRLQFYGVELAYYYILTQKIGCTLYDCNQYLKDLGYPQLGENYQAS